FQAEDGIRDFHVTGVQTCALPISYRDVQQGYVGYVYGESTSGQRALYELGMTGIPIVNVNNNCSTGSSALYLAAEAIRGGRADCVLALGFEKMQPGSLGSTFDDREQPMSQIGRASCRERV